MEARVFGQHDTFVVSKILVNLPTASDWKMQTKQGDTVLHLLAENDELELLSDEALKKVDWSILNLWGQY